VRVRNLIIVLAALAVLAAAALLVSRLERGRPGVESPRPIRYIGPSTRLDFVVTDAGTGLRRVTVTVRQAGADKELYAEDLTPAGLLGGGVKSRPVTVTLDPKAIGLAQGEAAVIVAARDNAWWGFGRGNETVREFAVVVDTIPPRVDVLSTAHNIKPGGTGLVVYRLGEPVESSGVEVGDVVFPGYPEKAGGAGATVCYFALPHDAPPGVKISLAARDPAGNLTRRTFPVRILERKFKRDDIELTEKFLGAKMPEFSAADPSLGSDNLRVFLTVNREWRKRDHDRLRELARKSDPNRLWAGPFLQMKNSKNMAEYAQFRTYRYGGKVVDEQTHLGLDLASTAGAPVPAANSGVVVLAGDLGIYGTAVVVDHGQGLFSLYAHLSGTAVTPGQRIERGASVGSSGQTGMAGGDHLHYAVLVGGVFVSPVEWLDEHWIDDNVMNKLVLFSGGA
jgi:murein DD-endopeptidase MepM/ murein hydrolase activator NlpD